uniref:Gnk2-homologous domain-containing protein n=1 Tax=Ananas comosus var. bracteatus TaxID=296719 RepID=A0A6V7PQG6_ANACO|nr:unnamed protein product [Ananas comosus var. bracteatus]
MHTPPNSAVFPSLLLISLFCLPLFRPGSTNFPLNQICGSTGNFTANSTYESNLRQLLPSLSSEALASGGFSTSRTGGPPDQAFGLASAAATSPPTTAAAAWP